MQKKHLFSIHVIPPGGIQTNEKQLETSPDFKYVISPDSVGVSKYLDRYSVDV